MPVFHCSCGTEILIVPNVTEMARCIEAHAIVHSQKVDDVSKSESEFNRIEEKLTQKVVIEILKSADRPQ